MHESSTANPQLAILCDFKGRDARQVVRYILQRLQGLLNENNPRLREYFGMLEVLSSNRDLQTIVNEEQSMLSSIKLSDLPSYQQGMQQGIQQGFRQGEQVGEIQAEWKIARTMWANGFSVEVIAQCTGLSVEELNQQLIQPEDW